MTKNEEIQMLLTENREILLNGELTNGICFDGIVDEDCFDKQATKLAVLLKETNGNDSEGNHQEVLPDWDYRSWLKEQQAEGKPMPGESKDPFYSSTFRKLCLWLAEFFDVTDEGNCDVDQYFLADGGVDISKVRTSLKKVALVNLKKSWGTEKTNAGKLYNYATNVAIAPILVRELAIISPDFVLCGSSDVFETARNIYGIKNKNCITKQSETMPDKVMRYMVVGTTVFVEFFHPAWYGKEDRELAEYAKEVFTWVIKENKK